MDGWGKVLVCTRYQPTLPAWTCESLIGLVQHGLRAGDQRDYVYSKTMHKAANICVRKLLETDCDSICFIDSDAVFGSSALSELRDDPEGWNYDVLQAFTVKRGWPPEPMFLSLWPDHAEAGNGFRMTTNLPLDDDCIYPVDAVSLHFTLIRRKLLEEMQAASGVTYWFEYNRDNGEDINFCIKAAEYGARFGMSTRLKVGHVSEVVSGWDTMVDYYDRKFAYEAGAPKASLNNARPYFEARQKLSELVSAYTGEAANVVYAKSNVGPTLLAEQWRACAPEDAEACRAFYAHARDYLYDLIAWNTSPGYQRLLVELRDVHGESVLDFGGGLGTTAEYLASRNNRVDYFDLGEMAKFAAWRFKRFYSDELSAPRVELRWANKQYRWVVALDVLEHLHPAEFETTFYQLLKAVAPGGRLFAHCEWKKHGENYPQHFDNSAAFAALLHAHGFTKEGEHTWRKP